VNAQFLLAREIEEQQAGRDLRSFVDASRIVNRQMRDRTHAYYPYKVALLYGEFWRRIANRWGPEQKSVFFAACNAVYQNVHSVDPDLATMDDVQRCKETVKEILAAAGMLPAS
jgi:hypothetical protein